MRCRVVSTTAPVTTESLDPAQVVAGDPRTGAVELHEDDLWSIGLWEHTVGASTDTEVDEVFVVISGRASIEVEGEGVLVVGPGDIGILRAGASTTWTVHEPLRKIYISPGSAPLEEPGT